MSDETERKMVDGEADETVETGADGEATGADDGEKDESEADLGGEADGA